MLQEHPFVVYVVWGMLGIRMEMGMGLWMTAGGAGKWGRGGGV